MKRLALSFLFLFLFAIGYGQTFEPGSLVDVYNSGGWYKASIVKAGDGEYTGYYYVKYQAYSQSQWIKASNIRLVKTVATPVAEAPRNGIYLILSYGNPTQPVRLGYFELNNGQYTYSDLGKKNLGAGTYTYDSQRKAIQWKTGPFKDAGWQGNFEIDREGKTHKIRLNRATIGSNSTDSQ